MKKKLLILVCVLGLTLISAGVASAIVMSLDGTEAVSISGTTLTFASGNNFTISGVTGGTGDANGDIGQISGSWTIGTITGTSAPVTGSGTLTISDGTKDFTATLMMVTISQSGGGVTLNYLEALNLSNKAYSGTQADLISLASAAGGIAIIDGTYIPVYTLEQLTGVGGPYLGSFSGTIESSTVPLETVPSVVES